MSVRTYYLLHLLPEWRKFMCIGKTICCYSCHCTVFVRAYYTIRLSLLTQLDILSSPHLPQGYSGCLVVFAIFFVGVVQVCWDGVLIRRNYVLTLVLYSNYTASACIYAYKGSYICSFVISSIAGQALGLLCFIRLHIRINVDIRTIMNEEGLTKKKELS